MVLSLFLALAIIVGTAVVGLRALKMANAWTRPMFVLSVALLAAAALTIGIRFGVFGEFQISNRIRMQGAPVPLVVFVLEGENWTDFVKPLPITYLCMTANALFPVAVVGVFVVLMNWLVRRPPVKHDMEQGGTSEPPHQATLCPHRSTVEPEGANRDSHGTAFDFAA